MLPYHQIIAFLLPLWIAASPVLAWTGSANPNKAPNLVITTGGTLDVIQQQPGMVSIAAVRYNTNSAIVWTITGTGATIVKNPGLSNVAGDTSTLTLQLSSQASSWPNWKEDEGVIVKAHLALNPMISSTVNVALYKFRRGGHTENGSLTLKTLMVLDSANLASSDGSYLVGSNPNIGIGSNGVRAAAHAWINPAAVTTKTPVDHHRATWHLYFQSPSDVGRGSYRFNETVEFTGHGSAGVSYVGWLNSASYGAAARVSAGFDNVAVGLVDPTATLRYTGFPLTITVGISGEGTPAGPTGGGSVSISLTLSSQSNDSDSCTPSALHLVSIAPTAHLATQNINFARTIDVAAAVHLEQQNNDEWNMDAHAILDAYVPIAPEIEFIPEL